MSPPTDDEPPTTRRGPAADRRVTTTSRRPDAPVSAETTAPIDDEPAIRRVLDADDARLRQVLRADRPVRAALRSLPGDREAECLRTLVAAARVERRRRRGTADLARAVDILRPGTS